MSKNDVFILSSAVSLVLGGIVGDLSPHPPAFIFGLILIAFAFYAGCEFGKHNGKDNC